MRVGSRIAFWYRGEVHAGTVTHWDPDSELVMLKSKTIDYDSVMVRDEDVIREEENQDE